MMKTPDQEYNLSLVNPKKLEEELSALKDKLVDTSE